MAIKLNNILSNDEVKALIGPWEVVWGPGIFQSLSSKISKIPDNTIYVAKTKGKGTQVKYVVAIAGTTGNNFFSFDWLIEDFFVSAAIPWPYARPGSLKPHIALGTYIGFSILKTIKPCEGLPGSRGYHGLKHSQTILDFFKKEFRNRKDKAEVITTGHSLGGALSPVLALWLADTKPSWDPKNKSNIKTYPSAGATPGDKDFAAYYDSRLPPKPGPTEPLELQQYTDRIWNNKDVVPHAWNHDDLEKIPFLYMPEIIPDGWIFVITGIAWITSNGHNYTQIAAHMNALPGKTKNNWKTDPFGAFLKEALYQHVNAYIEMLKVEEFCEILDPDKCPEKLFRLDLSEQSIEKLKEKLRKYRQ